MTSNRPQAAPDSGAPSSIFPPAAHAAAADTNIRHPSAPFASTGVWMDQSGWTHLGSSSFDFSLDQSGTSFNTEPLSDNDVYTGAATRGVNAYAPFRQDAHLFVSNPYGPNYSHAQQNTQAQLSSSSLTNTHLLRSQQQTHGFISALPAGDSTRTYPGQQSFPPAAPPRYAPEPSLGGGRNASQALQHANQPTSSSPVFTSAPIALAPQMQLATSQYAARPARVEQHPHHTVPPSPAAVAVHRHLRPYIPGSSHAAAGPSRVQRARRGGREKDSHLEDDKRKKSHSMRKAVACWRCALQRDPCPDEGTPCHRCASRSQKGQQYYFGCDRSKLPDFVHDFLPPSMTGMHQKQSIEDYISNKVVKWDKDNSIDIWLTCGYGPALPWKLYEFEPRDEEPCWQLQYLQDPDTRQQVSSRKYSPPFGLLKLDLSDDAHFDWYMDQLLHAKHLWEFGWTCFEEETQVDDFQARLLQAMCDLSMQTQDEELRELLRRILRMMVLTYIMGHTLTIAEETASGVLDRVKLSPKPPATTTQHVSPRLANRQLKFFFHILREKVSLDLLNWQQQTLRSSPRKDATWLPAFCVTLGLAMVLEEVQRTLWIQADAKARTAAPGVPPEEAEVEARNASERIDDRFGLLVGLFQCKYRDKKWGVGSFGNQTPLLRDAQANEFLREVFGLLVEKQAHLESRRDVPLSAQNQCCYTSRLVARFLLPFLGLPV
ncbi:hypothetical protein LTR53_015790 [Teratosphaeriaceae sp. CCFEE 6253]|nr:hypothetical protein LTR53_015790 [Teratosphaeriaceae sp. CCFEE 6253]